MSSFNKVLLMGNLTRDPETKNLPSGTVVTEFGVATNRKFKTQSGEDREEVAFVDCSAFGKQAEVIAEYFKKGRPIFLEGRLKYDTWDDKAGGKRSKLTVVVENFQFVGGPNDGSGASGNAERSPNAKDVPWESNPNAAGRGTRGRKPATAGAGAGRDKFRQSDIPF